MARYHGASICLNGHVASKYDANVQKRCTICGGEIYSSCPNCKSSIRGLTELDIAYIGKRPYNRPNYCHECGSPYPWTSKVLDSAVELLALDEELSPATKELIKNAIPDLLIDSPATPVAVAKYKISINKASEIVKSALYNLLVDVLSETAKKTFLE